MMRTTLVIAMVAMFIVYTEQRFVREKRSDGDEVMEQIDALMAGLDSDVMETRDISDDLYELSNIAEDKEEDKRGIKVCVSLGQNCSWRKYCCGDANKCNRSHWYSFSGVCQLKKLN